MIGINLRGTFNVFREAARRIRDDGRLIGLSSTTAGAQRARLRVLQCDQGRDRRDRARRRQGARRTRHHGQRRRPGPVETGLFLDGKSDADVQRMAGLAPQKRLGRPDDIAGVVAFLAIAAGHLGQRPDRADEWRHRMTAATDSQVILVTGAGSGIGLAIATVLALAGHHVHAGMRLSRSEGEERASAIRDLAGKEGAPTCAASTSTCCREPSSRAAVDQLLSERGRLDVVVNNAGMLMTGITEAFAPEQLQAIFDTNATSWLRVNRVALPVMLHERGIEPRIPVFDKSERSDEHLREGGLHLRSPGRRRHLPRWGSHSGRARSSIARIVHASTRTA